MSRTIILLTLYNLVAWPGTRFVAFCQFLYCCNCCFNLISLSSSDLNKHICLDMCRRRMYYCISCFGCVLPGLLCLVAEGVVSSRDYFKETVALSP